MSKISAFLGVARAPFLLLPVTLIVAGGSAAAFDGAFSWPPTIVAAIGLIALHASVNALNEYSDTQRTGIDLQTERTPFSGGSGTLPVGGMSTRTALVFGLTNAAVGLAAGIWLLTRVGWVLLPLMVIGAICVLAYTDVLARLGIGEAAAGLGLGALPVIGVALVQDGTVGPAAFAASVPAFFMTFNLLLLNEFPDEEADRSGGRKNLVLILGRSVAAKVYAGAAVAVPLVIAGFVIGGQLPPLALVALLPSLAIVAPLRWALRDPSAPVPIPALGANVMWNLATNTVLGLSLIVAIFLS